MFLKGMEVKILVSILKNDDNNVRPSNMSVVCQYVFFDRTFIFPFFPAKRFFIEHCDPSSRQILSNMPNGYLYPYSITL